jgi:hypothetical protein
MKQQNKTARHIVINRIKMTAAYSHELQHNAGFNRLKEMYDLGVLNILS